MGAALAGVDVLLCDAGPRDGLQNEPLVLAAAVRAELCRRLAEAGLPAVEAASFVHPRLVPAMAGAEEVVRALDRTGVTRWSGLVLNERGYGRAVACGLTDVNYTLAATEAFAQRNQGCSVGEAVATGRRLLARARDDGVRMRVTIAVSFGCPFEGPVGEHRVLAVAEALAVESPAEIVLADTIGVGVPTQVRALVRRVADLGVPVGGHFHDTRNTGVANAVAALEAGVATLDAAVGGAGGCPFAPGATGNVATEDLVYVLERMGVRTGVDLDGLLACSAWLAAELGRELPGAVTRAGGWPPNHLTGPSTESSRCTIGSTGGTIDHRRHDAR
jgi:hydroxymethylglutaryl-CoA lyase/(R)-citramalyl-CoA lyase